jgi:acetyltransferase-like isoleucine patch superfamily enzyme
MRFYGLPIIKNRGKIFIGKRFICCSDSRYNSIGLIQKVVIKSLRPNSVIKIGENTQISGCTISAASSIEIGNNVLVGSGVLITDGDSHPIDPNDRLKGGPGVVKGIKIHDNVFIGARAIILKGIEIGENSVIGAGSVVSKNIPANSLYAGNPCKFIKKL